MIDVIGVCEKWGAPIQKTRGKQKWEKPNGFGSWTCCFWPIHVHFGKVKLRWALIYSYGADVVLIQCRRGVIYPPSIAPGDSDCLLMHRRSLETEQHCLCLLLGLSFVNSIHWYSLAPCLVCSVHWCQIACYVCTFICTPTCLNFSHCVLCCWL